MAHRGRNKKKPKHPRTVHAPTQQLLLKKPTSFDSFADVIEYATNKVYTISRLREEDGVTSIYTLGTGFLVGDHRLMTCAHVIDDVNNELGRHQDADVYLFAQRNHPDWHRVFIRLKMEENLFVEQNNDSAVIYLGDDFYQDKDGNFLRNPSEHLDFERSVSRLGEEVGVLGYPLQEITFTPDNKDVDISGVFLRADKGVINTRYKTPEEVAMYEFTMQFNPGNSGGPILDLKTGKVIAMVHAYQSRAIHVVNEEFPASALEGASDPFELKSVVRALYSLGLSNVNYLPYEGKHGISFE